MTTSNLLNFYHVTTVQALHQILSSKGIDPKKAKGRRKLAWYVKREGVTWAIGHVLLRQKTTLPDLVVIKVHCTDRYMHQMNYHLLWATHRVHLPSGYESAATWLAREELKIFSTEAMLYGSDWYEHLREES